MTIKKLTAIACDNGLGHTRRVVAVLNLLHRIVPGLQSDLFASVSKCGSFSNWPAMEQLKTNRNCHIHNIELGPPVTWATQPDLLAGKLNEIRDHIISADLAWSDNIIEVLRIRPDTILSGSFFWHEVIEKSDPRAHKDYHDLSITLLSSARPVMIGTEMFSTPGVRKLTDFTGVGLYRYGNKISNITRDSVLLSCGLSGYGRSELQEAIARVVANNCCRGFKVLVEPSLYPENAPCWMGKASYTADMFARLAAGCIRPGMGTLCDMLLAGARPFMFSENSFEMKHNSSIIDGLGLGKAAGNSTQALLMMNDYLDDDLAQKQHYDKARHIPDDGIESTADIIAGII